MSEQQTIYRISECGHCPRRMGFKRLGYMPAERPEYLDRAAAEGRLHEEAVKAELRADDIAVYAEQEEYAYDLGDGCVLLGHIDGIINDHGNEQLLEVKSMSQSEFDRWMRDGRFRAFAHYADQLTMYLWLSGLAQASYVVKNRNNGYMDRQTIDGPPSNFEDILAKLEHVEAMAQSGLVPDAEFDPYAVECKRCEYRAYCMPEPPVLAQDQEKELHEAVQQYRRGKAMADEGKALVDAARLTLATYARGAPNKRLVFEQLMAYVYPTHSVNYPKKAVEELLTPEQLAEIAQVKDGEQCKVTDLAEKDKDND